MSTLLLVQRHDVNANVNDSFAVLEGVVALVISQEAAEALSLSDSYEEDIALLETLGVRGYRPDSGDSWELKPMHLMHLADTKGALTRLSARRWMNQVCEEVYHHANTWDDWCSEFLDGVDINCTYLAEQCAAAHNANHEDGPLDDESHFIWEESSRAGGIWNTKLRKVLDRRQ
jgi:hypothetical protein